MSVRLCVRLKQLKKIMVKVFQYNIKVKIDFATLEMDMIILLFVKEEFIEELCFQKKGIDENN